MTYLRVVLDSLHSLLLRLAGTSAELSLQTLLLLLINLTGVGSVVLLCGFRAGIQGLAVFLHGNQSLRLADIGADELGVTADSLVAILNSLRESHKLDEGSGTVRESPGVVRSTLGHLGKGINGTRPVRLLELLLAELASLFCLGGVDVRFFLGLVLGLFCVTELGEGVGSAVFGEGFVVVFNSLCVITELLVSTTNSREGPLKNKWSAGTTKKTKTAKLTWR